MKTTKGPRKANAFVKQEQDAIRKKEHSEEMKNSVGVLEDQFENSFWKAEQNLQRNRKEKREIKKDQTRRSDIQLTGIPERAK